MYLIDRRPSPTNSTTGNGSLQNKQRFYRRAKQAIEKRLSQPGSISGSDSFSVSVDKDENPLHEPSFRRSSTGGIRDHLLPGNKEYIAGDTIQRPPSGGGGTGSEGSPDGEGQDDFRFAISRDEYMNLLLKDLELPDLAKRKTLDLESTKPQRAGYASDGNPSNLALAATTRRAMARRMALKRPKIEEIEALEKEIKALKDADPVPEEKLAFAETQLEIARRRRGAIPYIDPLDTRYKRFDAKPQPSTNAVMFCLMDVSGSMTEHMKDLAKRYFTLLYMFLEKKYQKVEVVFIRHTEKAEEVDENTFFNDPKTGGTVVSTVFEEMDKVMRERYSPENWNVYAAQASDGDNTASDNPRTRELLTKHILPNVQGMYYVETHRDPGASQIVSRASDIWAMYEGIAKDDPRLVIRKVEKAADILPVFREMFAKKNATGSAAPPTPLAALTL